MALDKEHNRNWVDNLITICQQSSSAKAAPSFTRVSDCNPRPHLFGRGRSWELEFNKLETLAAVKVPESFEVKRFCGVISFFATTKP